MRSLNEGSDKLYQTLPEDLKQKFGFEEDLFFLLDTYHNFQAVKEKSEKENITLFHFSANEIDFVRLWLSAAKSIELTNNEIEEILDIYENLK